MVDVSDYVADHGLVPVDDPKSGRLTFRRKSFNAVAGQEQMDQAISKAARRQRTAANLSRAELAVLLGSLEQVYGRYERALTKFHATQILHMCELFRVFPDDFLFDAAPHLWGATPEEANERRRVIQLIQRLPAEQMKLVARILDSILAFESAS